MTITLCLFLLQRVLQLYNSCTVSSTPINRQMEELPSKHDFTTFCGVQGHLKNNTKHKTLRSQGKAGDLIFSFGKQSSDLIIANKQGTGKYIQHIQQWRHKGCFTQVLKSITVREIRNRILNMPCKYITDPMIPSLITREVVYW